MLDLGNINALVKVIFCQKKSLQSTNGIPENSTFGIILDRTSFYAEAGWQEYDTGNIVIDRVADFEVTNVQTYNGCIACGHLKYSQLALHNSVISSYDEVSNFVPSMFLSVGTYTPEKLRRWPLRNNHTATHILNFCLREVLGDHMDQKGSLVAPHKLRSDFSHRLGLHCQT